MQLKTPRNACADRESVWRGHTWCRYKVKRLGSTTLDYPVLLFQCIPRIERHPRGEYVAVVPGAVIRCRPVGALLMQDEAGMDEKVLAVPMDYLHPFYSNIRNYTDLPSVLIEQIAHFFEHYKNSNKENG